MRWSLRVALGVSLLASGCGVARVAAVGTAPVAIEGTVKDEVTGAPLAGVSVYVVGGTGAAVSAADGWFGLLGAAPAGRPLAVGLHAAGYVDLVRHDVRAQSIDVAMLPTRTTVSEELALRPAIGRGAVDESGDLTPIGRAVESRLAAGGPGPSLAEAMALAPPSAVEGRGALAAPPATIRVWRRALDGSTSSCAGRVDVIPFEQYVKGVVPHEWLPSWADEALRAGADCARTYAWFWVAAGGKYGCADLDDTTASQVYRDTTYASSDAAVDATTGEVVVTPAGSLAFAEYSAENGDPTADGVPDRLCAGSPLRGHGRGTCQWGTQRWATLGGKDHLWMLAHYYPGDAVVRPGAKVAANAAPRVGQGSPADQAAADAAGCGSLGGALLVTLIALAAIAALARSTGHRRR